MGAALAALFLLVLRLVKVTATISDETHLTARGAFRSHATAWPDVQGIEIEVNPGAGAQGAPAHVVVLYDASGHRRILPHLNDRNTPDLAREVAALREMWLLQGHPGGDSPVGYGTQGLRCRPFLRCLSSLRCGSMKRDS